MNPIFNYTLDDDTFIFTDTLTTSTPYITKKPRDHESIFFVTKGNLLYEKEDETEVVKNGQVGYVQKGAMDKSSPYECDEVSYIAINFSFDKEDKEPKSNLPFSTVCSKFGIHKYESLFVEAMNCFSMKAPGYMTVCNGIVMQIIGMIFNEYATDVTTLYKYKKIEKAMNYMIKNFNDTSLTISKLAWMVDMSEKNFRRLFFDTHKKTPYSFLQEYRIEKSKAMLAYTGRSISNIAELCGFGDIYSFSHCFKKHMGISPSDYRK